MKAKTLTIFTAALSMVSLFSATGFAKDDRVSANFQANQDSVTRLHVQFESSADTDGSKFFDSADPAKRPKVIAKIQADRDVDLFIRSILKSQSSQQYNDAIASLKNSLTDCLNLPDFKRGFPAMNLTAELTAEIWNMSADPATDLFAYSIDFPCLKILDASEIRSEHVYLGGIHRRDWQKMTDITGELVSDIKNQTELNRGICRILKSKQVQSGDLNKNVGDLQYPQETSSSPDQSQGRSSRSAM